MSVIGGAATLERLVTPWDVEGRDQLAGMFSGPPRLERHARPHAPLCQLCGVRGCRARHRTAAGKCRRWAVRFSDLCATIRRTGAFGKSS